MNVKQHATALVIFATTAFGLQAQAAAPVPPGDLIVPNWGEAVTYEFTPGGTRSTLQSGLNLSNFAFDSSHNLYASACWNDVIYEFTPAGNQSIFASGLNGPTGLVFGPNGNLYAADEGSGNIYEFSPNGARSTFASGVGEPISLAFTPTPEPPTLTILGIGSLCLLGYGWRRRLVRQFASAVAVVLALTASIARADVFNMGGTRNPTTGVWTGEASLSFVTVGNPGNAADMTTGSLYGSVGYVYRIGQYDVTIAQYVQFRWEPPVKWRARPRPELTRSTATRPI
jgi:hypothetical protein